MKAFRIFLNEQFILILIILNALVIFIQGFELTAAMDTFLFHADNLITLLFIVEMTVKINRYGISGFSRSGWNVFDLILVMLSLPSLILWLLSNNNLELDFLLILRVTRIFKFFRFIRFFPDIDKLIQGIKRALKASLVVLLGFFVFVFIFAIISCFLFRNVSPELFGNPMIALYTIFQVFTVEGWNDIPDTIAENTTQTISALSKFYFSFILLAGGIFGLSLVNSIFVDAMVSDNNDELEKKIDSLEQKIDKLLER
jgi:voltage-gated sodium channel